MPEITCPFCGKKEKTEDWRKKYCSTDCRLDNNQLRYLLNKKVLKMKLNGFTSEDSENLS